MTEEQFAHYFFETWDRLEEAARAEGNDPQANTSKPVYFRFLTLMAFHTYISEGVDAAIIECGIGGQYDSTNVITKPAVTAITNLGIDHVGVLGATLAEIAWHKAGIMKSPAICFTPSNQAPETHSVLEKRAQEAGIKLEYVDVHSQIQDGSYKLGLQADFQKVNASVALSIARAFLAHRGVKQNSDDFDDRIRRGLADVKWGGRCETRYQPGITWCIDGGHTLDSIKLAGQWFASLINAQDQSSSRRYLVFNQQTRDAPKLLGELYRKLAWQLGPGHRFSHVVFCTTKRFMYNPNQFRRRQWKCPVYRLFQQYFQCGAILWCLRLCRDCFLLELAVTRAVFAVVVSSCY